MTEPPRPPGDGYSGGPSDPLSPPPPPPGSYSAPGEASAPGYNAGYQQPPAGGYPPPPGGGYPPPAGGGYPPPAGGGYPPPGGYAPGPVGPPPPGYPSADDKMWALVAHFGGAGGMFILFGFGGFIAPLVAYLARGQQSPVVRAHALAALNFQMLWSGIGLIGIVLAFCLIGFVIFPIAAIIGIILGIIGGVKANEGQLYSYPMSYAFIK